MSLFSYDPWAVMEYLRVLQRMREIGIERPTELLRNPPIDAGGRAVDLAEYIDRIKRGED